MYTPWCVSDTDEPLYTLSIVHLDYWVLLWHCIVTKLHAWNAASGLGALRMSFTAPPMRCFIVMAQSSAVPYCCCTSCWNGFLFIQRVVACQRVLFTTLKHTVLFCAPLQGLSATSSTSAASPLTHRSGDPTLRCCHACRVWGTVGWGAL